VRDETFFAVGGTILEQKRWKDGEMHAQRMPGPVENVMNAGSPPTDEMLMALLSEGQDDSLAELVRRYQNDVFRFCMHYVKNFETAKEMAQETFLRIYSARERFDVTREFKPWMLCIARNLCLNEIKRKKNVQMETLEDYASSAREESGEILQISDDSPSERLITQERREALMRMLDLLPPEAREIVVLRYFERLSAREIADIMDSTEGAVRTRLHRALRYLQEQCWPMKDEL
jgi:RNA polymerase sigma-70 factor (ECF subfamily)